MNIVTKRKTIYLDEWTKVKPYEIKRRYGIDKLSNKDLDLIIELERQNKINIRRYSTGIEIESTSYVGIIKLSEFQIIITPKIPKIQLARMISFSFGLNNIKYLEEETNITAKEGLISEIMALLYIKEVEKLILKGLSQRYREKEEVLSFCRGTIVFNKLARKSSLGLTLPCRYQELTLDIPENIIILASLKELIKRVNTLSLKRKINILIEKLSLKVSHEPLSRILLNKVKQEGDRLTSHYATVIQLTEMIINMSDFSLTSGINKYTSFLLDMNLLFERFLYQYFIKGTDSNINIEYQSSLNNRYISKNSGEHRLMPDYLFCRDKELIAIADAKYKDYDNKSISSADLYQLTVYGIANQQNISTVYLFYPSGEEYTEKENKDICPPPIRLDI